MANGLHGSLPVVTLSPNALRVLEARYLRRDSARKVVETPEELFRRVAHRRVRLVLPPAG